MLAPLYRAAAERGIAGAVLDLSPPHVVRWMLEEPAAPGSRLDPNSEAAVRAQRVAASRGQGEKPKPVPFDVAMIGTRGRVG